MGCPNCCRSVAKARLSSIRRQAQPTASALMMQAAAIECFHRGGESAVEFVRSADDGRLRHPAIVEDDVTDMGTLLAHLAILRSQRDAGQVCIDQKSTDAASAFFLRIGSGEDRKQLCLGRVGDLALGAVENEVVAVGDS